MIDEKSCLYIVATPIGNFRDITLRAMDTLKSVDIVVCEEIKEGSRLLKRLAIEPHGLIDLNEHNEQQKIPELVGYLAQGKSLGLISDCGTPVFADPGASLIEYVLSAGFKVIPIPGPSSLAAALSLLDFRLDRFIFAGFLSRKTEERQSQLQHYARMKMPLVLMDAPYRLGSLLNEVGRAFGRNARITLACDLTLPSEHVHRGTLASIEKKVGSLKAEFVLIIH